MSPCSPDLKEVYRVGQPRWKQQDGYGGHGVSFFGQLRGDAVHLAVRRQSQENREPRGRERRSQGEDHPRTPAGGRGPKGAAQIEYGELAFGLAGCDVTRAPVQIANVKLASPAATPPPPPLLRKGAIL